MSGNGLPREVSREINYNELWGYLEAVDNAGWPVRVRAGSGEGGQPDYIDVCGFILFHGYANHVRRPGMWFTVNWPERSDVNGTFTVPREHFRKGHISTVEGNSYFDVTAHFDGWRLGIGDIMIEEPPRPAPFRGRMNLESSSHGLPVGTARREIGYDELGEYIGAIAQSNQPVIMTIAPSDEKEPPIFKTRAYIAMKDRLDAYEHLGFQCIISWPRPTDPNGMLAFPKEQFETASIETGESGHDSFTLEAHLGKALLRIEGASSVSWPLPAPLNAPTAWEWPGMDDEMASQQGT